MRWKTCAAMVVTIVGLGGCRAPRPSAPLAPIEVAAASDFAPAPWQPFSGENRVHAGAIRSLLCEAVTGDACAACLDRGPDDSVVCALHLAFADDPEAARLAVGLFRKTGTVVGGEVRRTIDAAHLGELPISAVLPMGEDRVHLEWLRDAFDVIEASFAELSARAPRPVLFRTRPRAVRFYRTELRSFPSAYGESGIIGYNVRGALYDSPESVRATLMHELFHLNDQGRGQWSVAALRDVFERIVRRCGGDHGCLEPYAPDSATVSDGTFYAFDPRTRDVREYAAELALRWWLEQRAALGEDGGHGVPFKCATPENAEAWQLVVDEFFGGLDLTRRCEDAEAPST